MNPPGLLRLGWASGALIVALVAGVPHARANCNAIPGVQNTFTSPLGIVDRPFASPGDFVAITIPEPTDGSAVDLDRNAVVVAVVFAPPNDGPQHAIVLTNAADGAVPPPECDALADCAIAGAALCVTDAGISVEELDRDGHVIEHKPNAPTPTRRKIGFRFPDGARLVGGAPGLAGPARIVVATATAVAAGGLPCGLVADGGCREARAGSLPLLACVDELYAPDGSMPPNLGETFAHFTALPPANDYRALCRGPEPCGNQEAPLYFAVDRAGNALVPIDWSGVVEGAACGSPSPPAEEPQVVPTTARFVRALFRIVAFADDPDEEVITLPSNAFLRSFTVDGHALAPIFDAQLGADRAPTGDDPAVRLYGFADGCRSVLRVARRGRGFHACARGNHPGRPCTEPASCFQGNCGAECGDDGSCEPSTCYGASGATTHPCRDDADCGVGQECGPALFELRDRLAGGVGPVAVPAELSVEVNVPIDGIQQTDALITYVVPEAMNAQSLNKDDDRNDEVLAVIDRRTGVGANTEHAVARFEDPPFSYPAFATTGNTVAIFEPEAAAKLDANEDGDYLDEILRVFRGAKELDAAVALQSTAIAPFVNGRSLTVSDDLVVVRTDHLNERIVPVSVEFGRFPAKYEGHPDPASGQPMVFFQGAVRVVFTSEARFRGELADSHADIYYANVNPFVTNPDFAAFVYPVTSELDANGPSAGPSVSSGALAFWSEASNLVANDRNVMGDVFARVWTNPLALMSVTPVGDAGNGPSYPFPAVSDDGRYVAFWSLASDLVEGDTNKLVDVFVRDTCWSGSSAVTPCNPSTTRIRADVDPADVDREHRQLALSSDGRFVVFASRADGLVASDHDGQSDVFVYDRCIGAAKCESHYELVSMDGAGASFSPVVSADGRFVAYVQETDDLGAGGDAPVRTDVLVRDRCQGAGPGCEANTERVSVALGGVDPNGSSTEPAISADGTIVVFTSTATNLVPIETQGGADAPEKVRNIFLRDRPYELTDKVSVAFDGAESNGDSASPSVSADGTQIAFASLATNLTPHTFEPPFEPDTNDTWDVFVRATYHGNSSFGPELGVFDVDTQAFVGLLDGRCPAQQVRVAGRHVAFLRFEADLGACPTGGNTTSNRMDDNGDGDNGDQIVHVWSPEWRSVKNFRCATRVLALSEKWVAALVQHGNVSRDTDLGVVAVHAVEGSAPSDCKGWREVRDDERLPVVGDALAIAGSVIAFLTPECAGGPLTTPTCPGGGTDLNQDGDLDDRMLRLYDADAQRFVEVTNLKTKVKQAATDFVLGRRFVAFRTPEGELRAYDFSAGVDSGCLLEVGAVAEPCRFRACDPRVPYRVGENTITFLKPDGPPGAKRLLLQTYNERLAADLADCPVRDAGETLGRRRPRSGAPPKALNEIGSVFKGICANGKGTSCVDDTPCGGSACIVPPGACVLDLGVSCTPASPAQDCAPEDTCVLDGNDPRHGVCRRLQYGTDGEPRTCRTDADCDGARCRDDIPVASPLVGPLAGLSIGAPVFVSAGQCVEPSGQVHGSCARDEDCPLVGDSRIPCRPNLITATAADTDGDEIPDAIDNCPTVPNPLQDDADADPDEDVEIGDACQRGCARTPLTGCVRADAGKARLAIDRRALDSRLAWQWQRRDARADFGAPDEEDAYVMCVYAPEGDGSPSLRLTLSIPAAGRCDTDRCWERRPRGLTFENRRSDAVGASKVQLRTGKNGTSRIAVTAKNAGPIAGDSPFAAPVRTQLVNLATGGCWEAVHSRVTRNDKDRFRGAGD